MNSRLAPISTAMKGSASAVAGEVDFGGHVFPGSAESGVDPHQPSDGHCRHLVGRAHHSVPTGGAAPVRAVIVPGGPVVLDAVRVPGPAAVAGAGDVRRG